MFNKSKCYSNFNSVITAILFNWFNQLNSFWYDMFSTVRKISVYVYYIYWFVIYTCCYFIFCKYFIDTCWKFVQILESFLEATASVIC